MRISLVSKGDAGNTCPYCRDTIGAGEGRRCNGCKTTLHRECADELHKCPTTGCGRSLSRTYPSHRIRSRPSPPHETGELSGGTKRAIGVTAVVVMLVGMCVAIPSGKDERKQDQGKSRRNEVTIVLGRNALHKHVPKWIIHAGPPWHLELQVREHDGQPIKLIIEAGTTFQQAGTTMAKYVALQRTVLKLRRGQEHYAFRVAPLDPDGWNERPVAYYHPVRPSLSRPASLLAKRWKPARSGNKEAEAVAVLWHLGHRGNLRPVPGPSVKATANAILQRLGLGEEQPATAPRTSPRTSTPPAAMRGLRFDPTRRVTRAQFDRLTRYRHLEQVVALVRQYLASSEPQVQLEAFRWLKANATSPGTEGQLTQLLVTSGRLQRILILDTLVKQGRMKYEPLQLIYARDLAVGDVHHPKFTMEHPKAIPLIRRGRSLYQAWIYLVGWHRVPSTTSNDRRSLTAIARLLEHDEEPFVAKTLATLRPGGPRDARRLAGEISRLARRFPHHPALWERLEELVCDRSGWVRTLAINAVTRGYYGGRILARVVGNPRRDESIRQQAALGSRYLTLEQSIEVWAAAVQGPPSVQGTILPLVTARRTAIKRSKELGTRVGRVLERLSRVKEPRISTRALELVFQLQLPNARSVLRRSQNDPVRGVLAVAQAARGLRSPPRLARAAVTDLCQIARQSRSGRVRKAAIRAVATFGHSSALQKLLKMVLGDEADASVRAEAARVPSRLERTPDRSYNYGSIVLTGLRDPKPSVRRAALVSAGALDRSRAQQDIRLVALKDTDRTVRREAYGILLRVNRGHARQVLFGWLKRTELRDQLLAVQHLVKDFPRDRWVRKKLKGIENHRDETIRRQVRAYLEK